MALIRPFRAVRYDEAMAGPLESLVAPPYDVVDDAGADASCSRAARTTSST